MLRNRVRTDLGTDSDPHRSTVDQIGAGLLLQTSTTSNKCWCYVSFDVGPSLSMCGWTSADATSHTTAGLDYQTITTIGYRKHEMFHCHSSLLDQVL